MQLGLQDDGWRRDAQMGQKVVAFGGGHGLSATLKALRHVTHQITAALVSLCDDSEWGLTWRDLMQLRLETEGPLDNHALGNLLIVGLWQMFEDPVVGLDWLGRLLDSHGRVLPMT